MTGFLMTGADPDEVWPLVRNFHYSRRMPGNIQHCYVVRREGGLFGHTGEIVAAAIFSIPPTRWSEEVVELTRLVRSPDYAKPLSALLSYCCGRLALNGWHLAVSFADWTQRHHGGIYQASGWLYGGQRDRRMDGILVDGIFKPGRSCNSLWGTQSPEKLKKLFPNNKIEPHYDEGKNIYWKPLTVRGKGMAKRLKLGKLPYPKPIATRPSDEPVPAGASLVQPEGVAP